jgi:hypothetical protein
MRISEKLAEKLVLKRQRHLKWRAFDVLEMILMILCGVLLFGFSTTVMFDIITREIGHPWLWLQEVTQTFFIYAIFIGAAVARDATITSISPRSPKLHGTLESSPRSSSGWSFSALPSA